MDLKQEKAESNDKIFYPWDKDKLEIISNSNKTFSNFSLWYNKYIPLSNNDEFKASNRSGNDNESIELYKTVYDSSRKELNRLLMLKHIQQIGFYNIFSKLDEYEVIILHAKLKSPMITGIGQTHPKETSMIFDHNIGLPYIPASSVKGIVRFAYILSQILDEDYKLKDEYKGKDEIDLDDIGVSEIFGGDKRVEHVTKNSKKTDSYMGSVIFLDAYSLDVPEIKLDIMNPHYNEYYQDNSGQKPPADYLSPVPIKFLVVKEGEEFIFRAIAKKNIAGSVKKAIERAITKEGVGAKTSLGYGLFETMENNESKTLVDKYGKYTLENMVQKEKDESERKKLIDKINNMKDKQVDLYFDEWQKNNKFKNDKEIADLFKDRVKKKKVSREYTSKYKIIAKILDIRLDNEENKNENKKNNEDGVKKAIAEIDKYINKGKKITKNDYNKMIKKYKDKFRNNKEVVEKLFELKKLKK